MRRRPARMRKAWLCFSCASLMCVGPTLSHACARRLVLSCTHHEQARSYRWRVSHVVGGVGGGGKPLQPHSYGWTDIIPTSSYTHLNAHLNPYSYTHEGLPKTLYCILSLITEQQRVTTAKNLGNQQPQ